MDEDRSVERSIGRLEGKVDSIGLAMTTVQGEITGLRGDFKTMEAGRLSRLEVQFATVKTEVSSHAKISGAIWAFVTAVIVSACSGVVLYFLVH